MTMKRLTKLTPAVLHEIVDRLVTALDPDKIVLFGSYAYGDPHEDSDMDILIVMPSDKPRWQRAIPAYEALRGLLIPKDLIVYTPEEVEEWSEAQEAFVTTVLSQGKVLYEKNEG